VAEEEAITKASAAEPRAQGLGTIAVTFPVRRGACDSCASFHGDSPIARHSGAHRRRRGGSGPPRLALGADRFGAASDDLDAVRSAGAGSRPENFSDRAWRGREPGRRDVCARVAHGGLLGSALWPSHAALARGFCGAGGSCRDLAAAAARRWVRVWLDGGGVLFVSIGCGRGEYWGWRDVTSYLYW